MAVVFPSPLTSPQAKQLFRCQKPAIVVVVKVLEVEVVAVAVFGISNLASVASLTAPSFDISLALFLVPPPIEIYLRSPRPRALTLTSTPPLSPSLASTATEAQIIHYFRPSPFSPIASYSRPRRP